jgi:phosphatidylglycerophosphate synthase
VADAVFTIYKYRVPELDAVVLAEDPLARVRIAGLTARERAVRVAKKVGAARVHVVDSAESRQALATLDAGPVVVIRADQLVHTPLVAQLPNDRDAQSVDADGSYAGAFVAADGKRVLAALASGTSDSELAAGDKIVHGDIARAPIATPEQRRAAHRLLYKILVKPQDNAITRYLYRPVSFPLTRLLVWTPITPNQISYIVAVLVALGCYITAHESHLAAFVGTVVILAASYLDCCDGEVARVKLLSSRFGAWIDTVVDELSSVGYMVAIGWHCHLAFGPSFFGQVTFDPWTTAIAISVFTYLWVIYCVYYNIIVAVGSANSQDYVGRFEVVPADRPNHVKLAPVAEKKKAIASDSFLATYLPYIVRRDFISWAAVVCAAVKWTHFAFGLLVVGGAVTFVIVTIDHVRLRTLRRDIERKGLVLETP